MELEGFLLKRLLIVAMVITAVLSLVSGLSIGSPTSGLDGMSDWRYTQSRFNNLATTLVGANRTLLLEGDGRPITIDTDVLSATIGLGSEVYYITRDFSLKVRKPNGEVANQLPPGSANGPIKINRQMRKLAYTKPDGDEPITNGLAVFDLDSGTEKTLLTIPRRSIFLLAWDSDRLLAVVPPSLETLDISWVALDGTVEKVASLTGRIPRTKSDRYPELSYDGKHLAYETQDGVWIVSVPSKTSQLMKGVQYVSWDPSGIRVSNGGKIELRKVPLGGE